MFHRRPDIFENVLESSCAQRDLCSLRKGPPSCLRAGLARPLCGRTCFVSSRWACTQKHSHIPFERSLYFSEWTVASHRQVWSSACYGEYEYSAVLYPLTCPMAARRSLKGWLGTSETARVRRPTDITSDATYLGTGLQSALLLRSGFCHIWPNRPTISLVLHNVWHMNSLTNIHPFKSCHGIPLIKMKTIEQ